MHLLSVYARMHANASPTHTYAHTYIYIYARVHARTHTQQQQQQQQQTHIHARRSTWILQLGISTVRIPPTRCITSGSFARSPARSLNKSLQLSGCFSYVIKRWYLRTANFGTMRTRHPRNYISTSNRRCAMQLGSDFPFYGVRCVHQIIRLSCIVFSLSLSSIESSHNAISDIYINKSR